MSRKALWVVIGAFMLLGLSAACTAPAPPTTMNHHDTLAAAPTPPTMTPMPKPGCDEAPIDINQYGGEDFQNPEEILSENGVLSTTLVVRYADNQIAGCQVHLRSYSGKLVGPTLRAKPGDTLYIHLKNELPSNAGTDHAMPLDTPHDFNTTNLHTHGLHVSPAGNSDNVLLEIQPGEDFRFEMKNSAHSPARHLLVSRPCAWRYGDPGFQWHGRSLDHRRRAGRCGGNRGRR